MPGYSLIRCVVNMDDASKTLKLAKKYGVKGGTISVGRGTVNRRLLNFLKINESRKEIITMLIERENASDAIKGISKDMEFEKPNHGIAFSHSVSEVINVRGTVEDHTGRSEVKNSMYSVIYVVVDRGRAEDVIESANKAGAKGGTIVNARGAGIHAPQKLFSIEIEPEKEQVFILTKTEMKDDIIESVRDGLNVDEAGNGIIFVLPVDEVYGIRED